MVAPKNWHKLCHAQVVHSRAAWGMTRHLKVWRHDGKSGISWDVLQAVKDDMLGADVCAVEIYPPTDRLINEVNMRHLWEVPEELMSGLLGRR